MFERTFTLYVQDLYDGRISELKWPPGVSVPNAGDLFYWEEEMRWVDDVIWNYGTDFAGEPRVKCTITLAVDSECEECGEVHA